MKRNLFLSAGLIILSVFSVSAFAQKATSFEIKADGSQYDGGELFITVGGAPRKIYDGAVEAWLISDGREVVFTGTDGAGGYENEGQSLRIYDVATGKTRKIMSHYYYVTGLSAFKLKNGQTALLVRLEDGGLGGSYFAVVDPRRGEVFFRRWAEITQLKNDTITLAFYEEEDWETINQSRNESFYENKNVFPGERAKVKPRKLETHDLKKILQRKVIYNKPTIEILDANLKNVKIYLWRANDEQAGKNFVLGAVEREVSSITPLQGALSELFLGAYPSDEEKGFSSPAFGMKFEGVVLKSGTATVKFSQPAGATNYGTLGPFIFLEAIEKTAKQFPTVKRVEVCAVGDTLIDAQLDKQFPRCRK